MSGPDGFASGMAGTPGSCMQMLSSKREVTHKSTKAEIIMLSKQQLQCGLASCDAVCSGHTLHCSCARLLQRPAPMKDTWKRRCIRIASVWRMTSRVAVPTEQEESPKEHKLDDRD
eukprot:6456595-Amphidinium_carterae.1